MIIVLANKAKVETGFLGPTYPKFNGTGWSSKLVWPNLLVGTVDHTCVVWTTQCAQIIFKLFTFS